MGNFWVPSFKWQLVEWFVKRRQLSKAKAQKMSKKELMGKYYEIRRIEVRTCFTPNIM